MLSPSLPLGCLGRRTWLAGVAGAVLWPAHAAPAHAVPPPDATLHYTLRRGFFSGRGEMQWRRTGDAYDLKLTGDVAGFSVLTQRSVGHVDASGLVPDRFTDQRVRRKARVAKFERDRKRVSFSSSPETYPIVAGMQDRLSWMIQLAALATADSGLRSLSGRAAMFVVGARGDGEVWEFAFAGTEAVRTSAGPVQAAKFTRLPRKPDDSAVEVWLDPARHSLPIVARLGDSDGGDALELRLRELHLP